MNKFNGKAKLTVIILTILLLTAISYIFYYPNNQKLAQSEEVTIEECQDTHFGLSAIMSTPIEKQKACAVVTLENAEPIEITNIKIGDTPLSVIEAFADGDFDGAGSYKSPPLNNSLKQCLDETDGSNAGMSGCLYDVEESLQRKIRSMVLSQIEQEKRMSYIAYASNPKLFSNTLKEYWKDWYISTTYSEYSTKIKECDIEVSKYFGGSYWYQAMPMCYIKYNANQILWLLNQRDEREDFFQDRQEKRLP
ncbi:MAG: hypothetical protein COV08_02910 [Candidatus Vogelbacteria bacterium CG10_big_fil_rev_8_21_14_0_10_49_38]|uniref:Uncharacterized protein n=1 Tax=Candidatus Vogelbacteria bacterium CG10_big_fil_rev_8_21_14_0_10_49_38 TaxID=1975043 RepID=A0A2H0RGY2_9BACT|nr:MAG: hypothetical protein BK006_02920 [bacterium CG10_49_38]PIR45821.1 MAG: hypothetical protein COV08_02910 [Candidatus Vogelbacteria bacterium CG10_big_fil_rev_8_21_14_0_10_49_38]